MANEKGRATIWRYVLTGAGLGLYFGLFFRPLREPNLLLVVVLSLLAALITVVFQMIRERTFFSRGLVVRFFTAWAGLPINHAPPPLFLASGAGQPKFRSTASAPIS